MVLEYFIAAGNAIFKWKYFSLGIMHKMNGLFKYKIF